MAHSSKYTKKDLDYLEYLLTKYKDIDSKINKRRTELTRTAHGAFEDNIGASKGNTINSPTERQAIIFDEDSDLMSMYAYKRLVEDLKARLEGTRATAFHLRFERGYLWEEVADSMDITAPTVRRLRRIILANYAEVSGYDYFR